MSEFPSPAGLPAQLPLPPQHCLMIMSKLAYSTLNRNYLNTISWIIAQIRSACKGEEILENNIEEI
jgi:hypothetical protein